jgi:hypothetical protein
MRVNPSLQKDGTCVKLLIQTKIALKLKDPMPLLAIENRVAGQMSIRFPGYSLNPRRERNRVTKKWSTHAHVIDPDHLQTEQSHPADAGTRDHDLPAVVKLLQVHGAAALHRLLRTWERDRPPSQC